MKNKNIFDSVCEKTVRSALRRDGFYVVPERVDKSFCQEIIDFIDSSKSAPETEVNYAGSEFRIWNSQSRSKKLEIFFEQCNGLMQNLMKGKAKPKTLLAIKNSALQTTDQGVYLGRWHIDSFSKQIKVFVFLSDTTEESGPFEFLPRSHRMSFKLKMVSKGVYFRWRDFIDKSRAYQKIEDARVEKLQRSGLSSRPVVCPAGTMVIVDTSAIHRARPCLQGMRYALAAYYD